MPHITSATTQMLSIEDILKIQMAECEIREIKDINKLQAIATLLWQLNLELITRFQSTTTETIEFLESRPWWLKSIEKMWVAYCK